MRSDEYEVTAEQIAGSIFEQIENLKPEQVGHGRMNLWKGASGFEHQIDASVRGSRDIWLIECKNWKSKVKAESVLAFAARIYDIQRGAGRNFELHPTVITTKGFQPGAEILAEFFGIRLDYAKSLNEFLIRFKQGISVAIADSFSCKDEATVIVRAANPNPNAPKA